MADLGTQTTLQLLVAELRAIAAGEQSTLNAGEADRFAAELEALLEDSDDA